MPERTRRRAGEGRPGAADAGRPRLRLPRAATPGQNCQRAPGARSAQLTATLRRPIPAARSCAHAEFRRANRAPPPARRGATQCALAHAARATGFARARGVMAVKRESAAASPAATKRPKAESPPAAAHAASPAAKRASEARAQPAALATASPFPRLLRPTPEECTVAVRTLQGAPPPLPARTRRFVTPQDVRLCILHCPRSRSVAHPQRCMAIW